MIENNKINEASEQQLLNVYLNSRGINPKFVTTDTKISHAKSAEFAKWKVNHQNDRQFAEEKNKVEEDHVAIAMGKELDDEGSMILNQLDQVNRSVDMLKTAIKKSDMQVPAWVQSKVTLATDYIDTVANYMASNNEESVKEAWDNSATKIKKSLRGGTYKSKPTALDKFRAAAAERAKKHDDAEKEMKARHAAGKEDMKGSIDRLEKQLNKEETEHKVGDSVTVNSKFFGKQKGKVTKVDNQSVHVVRDGKGSSEKYPHDAVVKEDSGISKTKETKFHKKLDKLVHSTFGKRKDELKMKEETEQIDELKKSTVFSWLKQQPVVPEKKPGMSRKDHNKKIKSHSKSWNRALDRLSGYKPTSEETENVSEVFSTGVQGHVSQATLDSIKNKRNVKVNLGTPSYSPKPKTLAKKPSKKASFISRLLNKEDTWQDSYAATQTTGMEIVDLPADEKYNKRKEMSKSARMIKSLYKNKGVKEGVDGQSGGGIMYDKEKTDKLETPYGKKPSMTRADKKMATGDKEPQAAAVLTGGKTLTGQDRDTLEIDPLMRKPGPLDQNKKT
jgi:hypothetical protein